MVSAVLDYARPARPKWLPKWLLRTLVMILIIAASAAIGAAIGDWVQPDLYIFNGSLSVPSSGSGTSGAGTDTAARDVEVAKQAHITAIRGSIPAAAATLNAHTQTPVGAMKTQTVGRIARRRSGLFDRFDRLSAGKLTAGRGGGMIQRSRSNDY